MPRSQHSSPQPWPWPDVMSAHPHGNGQHVGAAQPRPWPDVMSAHPYGNGQLPSP